MRLSDARFLKTQTKTKMLLPDNVQPENSIYYNAAFVIESLKKDQSFTLLELYIEVNNRKTMTFSVFILCLDWLYLIEIIRINNEGEIELCL